MPISKRVTEEEFVREVQVAGFVGAYKFWSELLKMNRPGQIVEDGEIILRVVGAIALAAREGTPRTPQEAEAFDYILQDQKKGTVE